MSGYGELIDKNTLRIERVLPGPIERVWSYLTEGEKRAQWICGGDMELREGGAAEYVFDHRNLTDEKPPEKYKANGGLMREEARVLEVDPPRLLRVTWPGDGEVEFRLAPQGEDTLLTLTHSRLVKRGTRLSVSAGWHTHLDVLEAVLSGRSHRKFWSELTAREAEYEKRQPQD